MEQFVLEQIGQVVHDPDLILQVVADTKQQRSEQIAHLRSQQSALERELKSLGEEMNRADRQQPNVIADLSNRVIVAPAEELKQAQQRLTELTDTEVSGPTVRESLQDFGRHLGRDDDV